MKKFAITLVMTLLITGSIPLWSEEGEAKEEERKGPRKWEQKMEMLFKELNLSEEQAAQVKKIKAEQHQKLRELREAKKEKRKQLGEILQKQDATRESVAPYVRELKEIQARMMDERINGIFAVKEVLSPEQFAKFQKVTEEWREKHKAKSRERRGNHGKDLAQEASQK